MPFNGRTWFVCCYLFLVFVCFWVFCIMFCLCPCFCFLLLLLGCCCFVCFFVVVFCCSFFVCFLFCFFVVVFLFVFWGFFSCLFRLMLGLFVFCLFFGVCGVFSPFGQSTVQTRYPNPKSHQFGIVLVFEKMTDRVMGVQVQITDFFLSGRSVVQW